MGGHLRIALYPQSRCYYYLPFQPQWELQRWLLQSGWLKILCDELSFVTGGDSLLHSQCGRARSISHNDLRNDVCNRNKSGTLCLVGPHWFVVCARRQLRADRVYGPLSAVEA